MLIATGMIDVGITSVETQDYAVLSAAVVDLAAQQLAQMIVRDGEERDQIHHRHC